jgi:putative DNA primase/helicase
MMDGCILWQKHGLRAPAAVVEATDAYLEAEDAMGAWITACCTRRATATAMAAELYRSWKEWAEGAGEKPGSQKRFSQALDARGFASRRMEQGRQYQGIEVGGRPTPDGS